MELNKYQISNLLASFLILVTNNLFSQNSTHSYINDSSENHKIDIYKPNDQDDKNIAILAITSGGFVMTDKDDLNERATELSKLGYTVYVPNYSDVMYSEVCKKTHKTWYKPLQEMHAALAYIETKHEINNIYLYGESAGAILALHVGYLKAESKFHKNLSNDFGSMYSLGKHQLNIKGVFTISGGVFDLSIFKTTQEIPLRMIHASCDRMVPFNSGAPLMCDEEKSIIIQGSNAIFETIKNNKTISNLHLTQVCYANHDITYKNFIPQFTSFIQSVENNSKAKIKKDILKMDLRNNEKGNCQNKDCN